MVREEMSVPIDWKGLARARGLDIPDADLEALAPRLDALEAAFRPLARQLTFDQEPAAPFRADPESE